MFERLADVIHNHAKAIIVLWAIVLIASVWPAMHAMDELNYDVSGMSGSDSESSRGNEIIAEYLSTDVSIESAQVVIIEFAGNTDSSAYHNAVSVGWDIEAILTTGEWADKISTVQLMGTYLNESQTEGMLEYAVLYNSDYGSVGDDTGNLRAAVGQAAELNDMNGITTYVTGSPAISYDMEKGAMEDVSKIDPFSILLVLILVGLFFRSIVSSAMPPMTIGAAFGAVMCALFFIAQIMDIFYITEILILVSMLGAGCDYCIFILARYREERKNGLDHEHALKSSIVWAGESITTSGIAVIIGFGSMAICSFDMISTMGIILALGIVFALIAALTLMTSILSLAGDKIFWPSYTNSGKLEKGWYKKATVLGHRYFTHSAKFSIKHAKAIIIAAVLFTVPMVYVYTTANDSYDMVSSLAYGEGAEGLNVIEDYTDGGSIMPSYIVVETTDTMASVTEMTLGSYTLGMMTFSGMEGMSSVNEISSEISDIQNNIGSVTYLMTWQDICINAEIHSSDTMAVAAYKISAASASGALAGIDTELMAFSEVYAELSNEDVQAMLTLALSPYGTYAFEPTNGLNMAILNWAMLYYTGLVGGDEVVGESTTTANVTYAKITVVTEDQAMSDASIGTVSEISNIAHSYADSNQYIAQVWIAGSAASMYEISEQVGSEFLKIEVLAVLFIIILLFFVMRSYLTPIRSVMTIMMSVVWTVAITHLLFTNLLGYGVVWLIPIILLVVCLGLGMDYDILLTTRIKENHLHRGMSNDDAITAAVTHSGSVITICGLIMGGAFGTLMMSSTYMLQEFGFALMFAILVDALIVRTYIVPAAMHLMGEWNWKGPAFLHRNIKKVGEPSSDDDGPDQ